MLTRDYFDFLVEHLSCATNSLPSENEAVFGALNKKLRRKISTMKSIGMYPTRDERMNRTLGLIVYASAPVAAGRNQHQVNIRKNFFEATFWSIYRYFPNILVYTGSKEDEDWLRKTALPIFAIERLNVTERDGQSIGLLKQSVLSTADKLRRAKDSASSSKWAAFDYVYYTEADHILQMRHVSDLFHMIDVSLGNYLITPHRMQALAISAAMPPALHRFYNAKQHSVDVRNASIVTISIASSMHYNKQDQKSSSSSSSSSKASSSTDGTVDQCCDHGIYEIKDCLNWWYRCTEWGLKDPQMIWMRYGHAGIPIPTCTEHKNRCLLSHSHPHNQLCPIPKDCNHRLPSVLSHQELKALRPVQVIYPEPILVKDVPTTQIDRTSARYSVEAKEYLERLKTQLCHANSMKTMIGY